MHKKTQNRKTHFFSHFSQKRPKFYGAVPILYTKIAFFRKILKKSVHTLCTKCPLLSGRENGRVPTRPGPCVFRVFSARGPLRKLLQIVKNCENMLWVKISVFGSFQWILPAPSTTTTNFWKTQKTTKMQKNGVFSSRRGLSGPGALSQEGALVQISGFSGQIFCVWSRTVTRPGPEGSWSVMAWNGTSWSRTPFSASDRKISQKTRFFANFAFFDKNFITVFAGARYKLHFRLKKYVFSQFFRVFRRGLCTTCRKVHILHKNFSEKTVFFCCFFQVSAGCP